MRSLFSSNAICARALPYGPSRPLDVPPSPFVGLAERAADDLRDVILNGKHIHDEYMGSYLLDIESGNGALMERLLPFIPSCVKITLTDKDPQNLALCREKFKGDSHEIKYEQVDLTDPKEIWFFGHSHLERFQLVVSNLGLYRSQSLNNTIRALVGELMAGRQARKDGGQLLFTCPNRNSFPECEVLCNRMGMRPPEKKLPSCKEDLSGLLQDHHFRTRCEEHHYDVTYDSLSAFLSSTKQLIDMGPGFVPSEKVPFSETWGVDFVFLDKMRRRGLSAMGLGL